MINTVIATPFAEFFEATRAQPVYVVLGVQGSGTNLLRRILVSAFDFSVVQDGSVIFNAAARLGRTPSPGAIRREYELIRSRLFPSAMTKKTKRLIKSNATFSGIDEQFDAARIRSGADLARFVYAYGAYTLGTDRMVIKSDDIWEHIDKMDAVLPNRRIILLSRDFRDNLLSIANKDFGPIEPLIAARYVKHHFTRYEAEFRRTPPAQRFQVRYEDLLEAPGTFVEQFSRHFRLEPSAQAAAAVGALPIRRNNVQKWSGLSERELARCEAVVRTELLTYGYQPQCDPVPPPGPAEWMAARSRDVVKRIPQKLAGMARRLRK
jgi:hypothetical protein